MCNSGFLNGMTVKEAIPAAIDYVEKHGIGHRKINYRLRDAIFSRQRYWGEPFPMYFKDGVATPMPMDKLPILVERRIPAVLVAGDSDQVVPYCENGILLERAYQQAGVPLEVYIKPGCDHHPHGLEDPTPALHFILQHCNL